MKTKRTRNHGLAVSYRHLLFVVGVFSALVMLTMVPFLSTAASSFSHSGKELSDPRELARQGTGGLGAGATSGLLFHDYLTAGRKFAIPTLSPALAESINTFASDCTTPKSTFIVNETVCAKTDGVVLNSGRFVNWIFLTSPAVVVSGGAGVTDITTNPQTFLFAPTATGSYKVSIAEPGDISQTPAAFTVIDPPPVATYADDCTTPKSTFTLGDTVCAKATGINPAFNRRFAWVDPSGLVRSFTPIMTDPQSDLFLLPSTETSVIDIFVIDNRGKWKVNVVSSRGSTVASAPFLVEGATASADLSLAKSVIGGNPDTGTNFKYELALLNLGPNDATNVEISDPTPANTTFVSSRQLSGPTFSCSGTSTLVCTRASLAAGQTAAFEITYTAGAAGSSVTNTATVSSDTVELHQEDNTASSGRVTILGAGGETPSCVLNCPGNITANANATQGGQPGVFVTFSTEPSGDCGGVISTPGSGTFFPVGTTNVTSTSSIGGGSCNFSVTVTNTPPPTIICPPDKTVAAPEGSSEATVNPGTPTVTTSGDGTVVGERSDSIPAVVDGEGNIITPAMPVPLTDPYPVGLTQITWTATDSALRTASCIQNIRVNATTCAGDTTPPTITAPPDVTVSTGPDNNGCIVALQGELGQATADDECSVAVTVSGIPAGNAFPKGTTTITYTATDGAGNTASDTQLVTVIDDTPPIIAAPPNASYVCPSEVPAGNASQATASDNCAAPTVTFSETSNLGAGTTSSPLIITRTFTATDAANHSASDSQTITVIDVTAPTIALDGPNPQYVECHTSYTELGATANDNCGSSFAAIPSGSVNVDVVGSYTITYTASDAAGNAATPVTRTVNVVDTTAPTMTFNSLTLFFNNSTFVFNANTVTVNGQTYPYNGVSFTHGDYTFSFNGQTITINGNTYTFEGKTLVLWLPLHQYQNVKVEDLILSASDGCDSGLSRNNVVISQVTSDEPANTAGNDDGNTPTDIVISPDCKSVQLRAERANSGNGRFYTITSKVTDASGNTTTVTSTIRVRRYPFQAAVDSGPQYTVNGSCP